MVTVNRLEAYGESDGNMSNGLKHTGNLMVICQTA